MSYKNLILKLMLATLLCLFPQKISRNNFQELRFKDYYFNPSLSLKEIKNNFEGITLKIEKEKNYFISSTISFRHQDNVNLEVNNYFKSNEKLEKLRKKMVMYEKGKEQFHFYLEWLNKLEKGREKERAKSLAYKQKNDLFYEEQIIFEKREKNLEKIIEAILNLKDWDWKLVFAHSVWEGRAGFLPYGLLDEVGPFHARKIYAKVYAKTLGIEGEIDKILLQPEKALLIHNYHFNILLKNSHTPEEALQKYNAGKYWQKYKAYSEGIKEVMKEIAILEEYSYTKPFEFALYYLFKTSDIPFYSFEGNIDLSFWDSYENALKIVKRKIPNINEKKFKKHYSIAQEFIEMNFIR